MKAYEQGLHHLEEVHGLTASYYPGGYALGSSQQNAAEIKKYLESQFVSDKRPFIVIAYSKGVADSLEALDQETSPMVKALVSVAGTVGGSWLANDFAGVNQEIISRLKVGPCEGGDGGGVKSLHRDVRQRFLQSFNTQLPVYSFVAVSTESNTSKVLLRSWRRLSIYAAEEDSQVIAHEGVVPASSFLGVARADHWAVAMPFSEISDPKLAGVVAKFVNHNPYPRSALLEALVRFVLMELRQL